MTATNERLTEPPKAYDPTVVEGPIYQRWLEADVFAPDGQGSTADPDLPPFVIIQPPPNITGALHLGHALTSTIEDTMIRRARMIGHPTLWLPGLDHASIAAQYVLDRMLAEEGESRDSLGRDRYLARMWDFINATREVMLGQQRRLGSSLDWSRLRFTMDEVSARAVRESFTRLYREGLAYRTEALVNWCPGCMTSVSDLEVIPTEEEGKLWTVRYHLIDPTTGQPSPGETIAVATTRPETLLGDTAVAVHPDDERYRRLVGRQAVIPFVDRVVPVIADQAVERGFGTGAVKVTPAHDSNDYAIATRHQLPMVNVLNDDATINANGGPYEGLDRYAARERIVANLTDHGELAAAQLHRMLIGRCQRSNDVIEPRLKTQWFIRTAPLAEQALAATRSGRTTIVPDRFVKVWEHWLTNIHDWNVSRQLWWGHRIPAWYCPDGHATVSAEPEGPGSCDVCGRPASELVQDPDIFDTWYSSGLWPFSTLGWPEQKEDLRRYYPGSVMETGYDIIFFWVARMMMLGIHFMGDVPFRTVYLHGLVKDPYGQRMSKTKGNVVDPLEAIAEAGADALRFALINGTSPGNDQKFRDEKLEDARNFANKLWNAARFVRGARPATIPEDATRQNPDPAHLGPAERWILSRMTATAAEVDRLFGNYAFGEVTRVLYDAIWSEYCDWYLELSKVRLADAGTAAQEREATWWTLVEVLDAYLRLLHPVMPFVTEAIWQTTPHRESDPALLMVARWPGIGERDRETERRVSAVIDLVRAIRNARAEARIEPAEALPVDVAIPLELSSTFAVLEPAVERMTRARPLTRHLTREALHAAIAGVPGNAQLTVLAGDAEARVRLVQSTARTAHLERGRLEKELVSARAQLAAARARLANDEFVANAPREVVAGARSREAELAEQVARIEARLDQARNEVTAARK